jgi:hypothetical protein
VKAFAKETRTATITPSSTPVREKAKGMGKTDLQSGQTESGVTGRQHVIQRVEQG